MKQKVFACFLRLVVLISLLSISPTLRAQLAAYDWPVFLLSQNLNSPNDVAHFLWKNFIFETDQHQFGQEEHWQTAEEFLINRKGDCEDFALLASELLRMKGIPSFLLNIYGDGTGHTVCVFKQNGKYRAFNGSQMTSEAAHLKQLITEINPFWKKAFIVAPLAATKHSIILQQIERDEKPHSF